MNCFHFGPSRRPLFGVYDAPGRMSRRGVVLCPAWGNEHLRAHKAMRRLAVLLADAGFHVLRFDYYGTGDSGGDTLDARPSEFAADARTAIEELRDVGGVTRVSLVGLRLGAMVAARAVAGRRDVDRVVLWDPVLDPAEHLEELLTGYGRHPAPEPGTDGVLEASGFALSPAFRDELAALWDADAAPVATPTRVVVARDDARARRLVAALQARGTDAGFACIPGAPVWQEERQFGTGPVPAQLLGHVVAELAA